MKKLRHIAIVLSFIIIIAHSGCMSTSSPARGGISGTITDSSGNPVSGARVSTPEAATLSDVNGKWTLESLTPQMTQITVSRENYQGQSRTVEVLSGEMREEIDFVLAADSDIYDIQVSSITSTKARIVFYTKKQSTGYLRYGKNGLLNAFTPEDTEPSFLHQYELSTLTPATTYRFKCIAKDDLGRTLESEPEFFTTEFTIRSDPPSGLKAEKIPDSNTIQLTWNKVTTTDFSGYRLYRSELENSLYVQVGSGIINSNGYQDMEVQPGRKYYYKVSSVSGSGDESPKSEPASFLMPGRMNRNAVWSSQNSPYILGGDLVVAPGVSLVIEQGVSVGVMKGDQWDAEDSNDLISLEIQGTLMVQGTTEAPVSMTSVSQSPQAGDWDGIVFNAVSDINTSVIKGLHISCAVDGLRGSSGIPEVRQSRFFNCKESGVQVTDAREEIIIRDSEFDTCSSGILAQDNNVSIQITDNTILRCIYGIVCRDNQSADILRNKVSFAGMYGIDTGNSSSMVKENLIGYGSSGTGIMCRGNDEIRRNTIHCVIGVELKETATARIRSNLLLADETRNSIGVLYSGNQNYSTASNTIQYNVVWDIPTGNVRRYLNSDQTALPGISTDMRLNPALSGGDMFNGLPNLDYSYVPSPGSPLKAAGYDNEDVGAFNVPN